MNVKDKRVELRSSKFTQSNEALQMGADFVSAFAMGFDIDDAIALLRLDSLYIQSFDIKDVKQTLSERYWMLLTRQLANMIQLEMPWHAPLDGLLEKTGYVLVVLCFQNQVLTQAQKTKFAIENGEWCWHGGELNS